MSQLQIILKITQTVILEQQSSRLDFKTQVNFQEKQRMLRVQFPVAIYSFSIPFRPFEMKTLRLKRRQE